MKSDSGIVVADAAERASTENEGRLHIRIPKEGATEVTDIGSRL